MSSEMENHQLSSRDGRKKKNSFEVKITILYDNKMLGSLMFARYTIFYARRQTSQTLSPVLVQPLLPAK